MSTTLSGGSDDLIELEGDLYEEFPYLNQDGEGDLVAFSTGLIVRVTYTTPGVWRIATVITGGTAVLTPAPEDDDENYSDKLTIYDPVQWAVQGVNYVKAKA